MLKWFAWGELTPTESWVDRSVCGISAQKSVADSLSPAANLRVPQSYCGVPNNALITAEVLIC